MMQPDNFLHLGNPKRACTSSPQWTSSKRHLKCRERSLKTPNQDARSGELILDARLQGRSRTQWLLSDRRMPLIKAEQGRDVGGLSQRPGSSLGAHAGTHPDQVLASALQRGLGTPAHPPRPPADKCKPCLAAAPPPQLPSAQTLSPLSWWCSHGHNSKPPSASATGSRQAVYSIHIREKAATVSSCGTWGSRSQDAFPCPAHDPSPTPTCSL